jgi:hypothetical protein
MGHRLMKSSIRSADRPLTCPSADGGNLPQV